MSLPAWLSSQLLSSSLLGADAPHRPVTAPPLRLGSPGRCGEHATLVIAVFDDSASVTSPVGADPVSNRYAEAREAFRVVGRACRCRRCLGAVVHFDLVGGAPPTPLAGRLSSALQGALGVPPMAAGRSVLGPSLEEAFSLAEQYPDHRRSLLVLSDFALMDPDPSPVLSRLNGFPGDVHAVVLGGRLPDGVLDPRIQVTPVTAGDEPGAVARAVFSTLAAHRVGTGDAGSGPARWLSGRRPVVHSTTQ